MIFFWMGRIVSEDSSSSSPPFVFLFPDISIAPDRISMKDFLKGFFLFWWKGIFERKNKELIDKFLIN